MDIGKNEYLFQCITSGDDGMIYCFTCTRVEDVNKFITACKRKNEPCLVKRWKFVDSKEYLVIKQSSLFDI